MPKTAKQEGPVRATRSKKQDGKSDAKSGKETETETGSTGGVQSGNEKLEGAGVVVREDFESLKQYMSLLHKNTEDKFEEALAESKNEVRGSQKFQAFLLPCLK